MKCTNCGSTFVDERRIGMSVGAGVGAAAGAYLGVRHINSEDKEDDFIGAFGLFAACTLAGAAAGSTLDGTLIDNYVCNKCDHSFKYGLQRLSDIEDCSIPLNTGMPLTAGYRAVMDNSLASDEEIASLPALED